MKKLFFLFIPVLLLGCASSDFGKTTSGGAVYEYNKVVGPNGVEKCTVRATSSREVMGATLKISDNCSFETVIDEAKSPFEVIDRILDLVPATAP